MSTHVVMEQPGRPDRAAFVADRFVFTALLFPVLWLAWHRLWVEALAVVAAGLAISAVAGVLDGPVVLLGLLVGLYVALEGPSLRIAALERRGYRQAGVIEADSVREAELRYVHGWHSPPAHASAPAMRPAGRAPGSGDDASMFGLIDVAGGR